MAEIKLSMVVDIGEADAAQAQDELVNVVLDWVAAQGYQAAAGTGDDSWLERELAEALRRLLQATVNSFQWTVDWRDGATTLKKFDIIYQEPANEAPADQP